MIRSRNLVVFAALNGAMAVMTGAFAAHGAGPEVKSLLTTGAYYQLAHAVLAMICAVWPVRDRLVRAAGWMVACGGLVFATALSLIALGGLSFMGVVAPVGGMLMIMGWILLAIAGFRSQTTDA
ncbi:DUF423 domain-containing protein [Brevundimonas sp.]|uniref:DUF423 domain-containing protein n=1 Tax=Brevundimonas sp. TaxID=1871086 RepID=UPI003A919CD3